MIKFKGVLLVLIFGFKLTGQVSVTADIPAEVAKNKEIVLSLKFDKGPIKNYSKYEMLLPEGMTVKELDCKYGAFSFDANKVRIIWAITPAEHIYSIQLKLYTGNETGPRQISQTYAYAEKGEKLELEMAKIKFNVVDSVGITAGNEIETKVAENNEGAGQKEVAEIKNESKEAEEIGLAEKRDAEKKIAEAKEELRKADMIANPSEKKAAIEAATQKQRKAEEELAAAERILVLSGALSENATKKEQLNQTIDSIAKPETNATVTTNNAADINHHPSEKIEKAKETAMNKGAEDAQDLYKAIKPEEHHEDLQIEQQVSQLRLDSKDALEVGTREKHKAEAALHDAYEALKKTKYIPDAEEKKLAVDKANADIEQAKSDLEIASKILTLSKSLEENAKEIERLHLNDDPKAAENASAVAVNTTATVEKTNAENSVAVQEKAVEKTIEKAPAETTQIPVENTTEKTQEKPAVAVSAETSEKTNAAVNIASPVAEKPETKAKEIVIDEKKEMIATETKPEVTKEKPVKENLEKGEYTLQLGSFVNNPDLTVFKKLGKVDLRNENGKYKVYYGKFSNKQQAVEMRQKTVAKGFDCFVVTLSKS